MSDLAALATPGVPSAGRCPACARPIAVSGRRCLYCGATLPERAEHAESADVTAARPERTLLVVDVAMDVDPLARALGLSTANAAALQRKSRYSLLRVLPPDEVPSEASRLAAAGVTVYSLREADVWAAAQPMAVVGGAIEAGLFTIGGSRDTERVAPSDVLLVLWGPIRREPQSRLNLTLRDLRRPTSRGISDSELIHIHTRSRIRPIEIDPQSFTFTVVPRAPESSLLRLHRALEALAGGALIDRAFRNVPPALGVSDPAKGANSPDWPHARGSRAGEAKPATALDNVAQFRFYSAWRGVLARQLARLTDERQPTP